MIIEIKIPSPGESISEVQIASWLVKNGDYVEKNAEVAEIESDKATFAISAPESGAITISVAEGNTVAVGAVVATINSLAIPPKKKTAPESYENFKPDVSKKSDKIHITPVAKNILHETKIAEEEITNKTSQHFINKKTVIDFLSQNDKNKPERKTEDKPSTSRIKMSPLRLKLSQRLVAVKQQTAMLTTFNEVNMAAIYTFKNKYSEVFKQKFGYSLGFVSFFAKAAAMAIKEFPLINAAIDRDEIVFHDFVDINIAVSSPKGLITPVIRNVELMDVPHIEKQVKDLGAKASKNRISLEDLTNGTFTISNGGTFGSLMSTPIINPPQSAILGLHKISERAMVVKGKIEILPMMYIALSYDHRLIDGKESVGFVMKIKELIENPVVCGLASENEFDEFIK